MCLSVIFISLQQMPVRNCLITDLIKNCKIVVKAYGLEVQTPFTFNMSDCR